MLRSPALMPVLFYAVSGGAYALANLLLARRLPERDFALFTLVLALMNLGPPLAAAGLDGVAVRGGLRFVPRVAGRVWLAACLVGLGLGAAAATYGVSLAAVGMIVVASAAGGATIVAAAEFQRRHRFALSLALVQAPNYTLLLAAGVVIAAGAGGARLPLLVMTAGFIVAAGCAWWLVLREPRTGDGREIVPWRDALTLAATSSSGSIMTQLDRLIIPYLLPLSALATYGVLSSVAGSLFRVLQRGVGYALLPRLRAAGSVAERRRLVAGEARLVAAVALVGSVAIWVAMPLVERWLLEDKYHFSGTLVLAALVAGSAKILHAFSRATVTALADSRELGLVNLSGWASLALSAVAAVLGARWGLAGVIYGVGLGWLFRALAALAVTYRHLRPVQQPAL
jgi:O-antigen/teichoic acid export membrane protein